MKGGQNGFFIVLLSLSWWYLADKFYGSTRMDDWNHALDDVLWVLDQMKASHLAGHKRSQDEAGIGSDCEDGPSTAKKCVL